jgi:capsular exopolysaccharide synthesis family protein
MDNQQITFHNDGARLYSPSDVAQQIRPIPSGVEGDDEIDLKELFLVLRKRLWLIFLVAMVVFIACFVVTLSIEPSYRASAKIQIESEDSGQVLSFDVALGESGNDEFYQTQYELLKSYTLAKAVITDLGLEEYFGSGVTNDGGLMARMITYSKTVLFGEERALGHSLGEYPIEEQFLKGLTISPVKKSQIVKISYDSADPDLAKRIVNAISKHFMAMTLSRRLDTAKDAQNFLDIKVTQAANDLEVLEKQLTDYAKNESIIQVNGESAQSLGAQKTAELSAALTLAQGERISAEARFRELSSSNGVLAVLEDPSLQSLKTTVIELQGEYQKSLQKYKPGYPSMVRLRKQIYQFQQQVEQQTAVIKRAARGSLQAVYLAAKQKENNLKASLDEQKDSLLTERDKGIEYGSILRQVSIKRKVYEGLLLRATEVSIAAGIGANNISVVDPAILPYQAQSPNVKMNLALGGVLGVMLGVVLAFLLEFLSTGIKSSDELKKALGLPLLGIIPLVKGRPFSHFLATSESPSSAVAEAFRSVRTNLLFSSADGVPAVIAVTSTVPSEGKSSSCMNIATAFANAGSRVLLVDADMRKPVAHKHLKLDNSLGLSNFLSKQIVEVDDVIQETSVEGVFAITSGPIPPNPSELLSSRRLDVVFDLAPERFDVVIIDSPPVIGLADALVIANRAQATIFVSSFDAVDKRAVQGTLEKLKQARANVLGVLFTKVKSGVGYSSYYGDVYQYQYGEVNKKISS